MEFCDFLCIFFYYICSNKCVLTIDMFVKELYKLDFYKNKNLNNKEYTLEKEYYILILEILKNILNGLRKNLIKRMIMKKIKQ